MVKRGRPKGFSSSRDRMVTVCLSEKAAILLDRVKRKRVGFNFSEYVSRSIVDDFGDNEGIIKFLKSRIGDNNDKIALLIDEIEKMSLEIKSLENNYVEVRL